MHYAFDAWMAREFPGCPFERYADDAVVHCKSRRQAELVLAGIAARMVEVGLRLHPDKTRIVYCKDSNRRGEHEHTSFTFLGYRLPATGGAATQDRQAVHRVLARDQPRGAQGQKRPAPRMRIHRRTDLSLDDLAGWLNPIIAGWMNYYGRYYRTAMDPLLQRVNTYMRRWAAGNTSGCGPSSGSSGGGPDCSNERPACSPTGGGSAPTLRADQKSPVTGDCHAGIRGSRGRIPPATRPPCASSATRHCNPLEKLIVRARLNLKPMHRGRLPALCCRHVRVDGLQRLSGRTCPSPSGNTPHRPSCRRPGANPQVVDRDKHGRPRAHRRQIAPVTGARQALRARPYGPPSG